jgi:hypothetical protein
MSSTAASRGVMPDGFWAYTYRMRHRSPVVHAVAAVLAATLLAACGASGAPHLALVARQTPICSPGPTVPAPARTFAARANCFISHAQREVVARHPSCSPVISNVPATVTGAPPPALSDALAVLRRPQTANDHFPGSGEIGVSLGPGPAPAGPAAFVDASRRARSTLGVTIYLIPAAAATEFRLLPTRCTRDEVNALQHDLAGADASLRDRIIRLQRTELRTQRQEALNPGGIVLGTVNAKAFGIDGTATFLDIKRSGLLDINAGSPVRAVTVGVVPDDVSTVTLRYSHQKSVTARVVENVFVIVPPKHARLQAIVWRTAHGTDLKTIPAAALTG